MQKLSAFIVAIVILLSFTPTYATENTIKIMVMQPEEAKRMGIDLFDYYRMKRDVYSSKSRQSK